MRRALIPLVALLLAVSGGASAGPTRPHASDHGVASIQVDDAHQQVFVTGDPGDGVLLVTDLTGHVVKTFSGESGAAGMVLSGTTL